MRDGPACFLRWSDVPPSGHRFFLRHDQPPDAHVGPRGDRAAGTKDGPSGPPGVALGPRGAFFTSATNKNLPCDSLACPRPRPAAWKYLSTAFHVMGHARGRLCSFGHHVPTRDRPWRVVVTHVRPRGDRATGLSLGSRRTALAARGPTWPFLLGAMEGSPSFPRKTRVQAARRGKEVKEVGKKFWGQSPAKQGCWYY